MKHNAMAIDVRTRITYSVLAIMTIMFSLGKDLMAQTNTSTVKNIVLVHGGLGDGSGWKGVYKALKKNGYTVAISRIRPSRSQTTWRSRSARSPRRTAR